MVWIMAMMSVADTTAMLSVMPKDLATSLMSLSFSSSWIGFLGDLGQRNLSIADLTWEK
jgi:hypothetical protein